MSTRRQPRKPAGTPVGGQFAPSAHDDEDDITLAAKEGPFDSARYGILPEDFDRWGLVGNSTVKDDLEPECPKCGTPRSLRTCADCGVSARLVDCGHYSQPRPISADGAHDYCDDCYEARRTICSAVAPTE